MSLEAPFPASLSIPRWGHPEYVEHLSPTGMLLTVPKGYSYDLFLPLPLETERDSGEVLGQVLFGRKWNT